MLWIWSLFRTPCKSVSRHSRDYGTAKEIFSYTYNSELRMLYRRTTVPSVKESSFYSPKWLSTRKKNTIHIYSSLWQFVPLQNVKKKKKTEQMKHDILSNDVTVTPCLKIKATLIQVFSEKWVRVQMHKHLIQSFCDFINMQNDQSISEYHGCISEYQG